MTTAALPHRPRLVLAPARHLLGRRVMTRAADRIRLRVSRPLDRDHAAPRTVRAPWFGF